MTRNQRQRQLDAQLQLDAEMPGGADAPADSQPPLQGQPPGAAQVPHGQGDGPMTRNQTQRLLDAQLHGDDQSLGAADARAASSHSVWSLSSESTSERHEDSTSEPHEEDSLPEDPSSSSLEDPDLDVDGGQAPGGEAYVPSCSWSSPCSSCPTSVSGFQVAAGMLKSTLTARPQEVGGACVSSCSWGFP